MVFTETTLPGFVPIIEHHFNVEFWSVYVFLSSCISLSQTCFQTTVRGSTGIMSLISLVILCTTPFQTSDTFLLQQGNQWCWSSWKNCYSLKRLPYYRVPLRQKILFISEILVCKNGNHSVHMQHHIHHYSRLSSTNLCTQAFLEKLECLVFCQGGAALSQSYFSCLWNAVSQNLFYPGPNNL